jgi:hypothetical protein
VSTKFKDVEHYVRAAILFGVGIILFLVIRAVLIPKDFGEYGHYRPGALADNAALPLVFAGRAACEECHSDVVESRAGHKHEHVACEACHWALAAHAEDPSGPKPTLPDATTLCRACHERNVGRPAAFPQVVVEDHSGGEPCTGCHQPHHPEVE